MRLPQPSSSASSSSSSIDSTGAAGAASSGQKPLMVERREKRPAFLKRAKPVEAHGVEPLEDVAIFPMLRRVAVLLDKPLDFLESGDDALLARGAAALLFRLGEVVEFGAQFVEIEVTHSAPRP